MLSIRNIVKQYGTHKALDQVSLEIGKGSIFGLLGPNGAGKTTLIRIINQIIAPDTGELFLNGEKLNPSHVEQIGYLPEERGLYKKMKIGEQVLYLAQLKGLTKYEAAKRAKYWFEKLEIQGWWNKKVEDLSKGMQQKVQFVVTVMHNPKLIILDEPFSGFDPINADLIKNEILELNSNGATIIFSTHRMESVEELCDSIALIHQSKKILEGKITDIKELHKTNTYKVHYRGDLSLPETQENKFELIRNEQHKATFKLHNAGTNELLQTLLPVVDIYGLEEVVPTINDIFISKVKS
jgi:ABC-2 type transport system ATP-binding protein